MWIVLLAIIMQQATSIILLFYFPFLKSMTFSVYADYTWRFSVTECTILLIFSMDT